MAWAFCIEVRDWLKDLAELIGWGNGVSVFLALKKVCLTKYCDTFISVRIG